MSANYFGRYTTKMEGMYHDMQRADGLNAQFAAWDEKQNKLVADASPNGSANATRPLSFFVRVLTMGTWPTYPKSPTGLKLPQVGRPVACSPLNAGADSALFAVCINVVNGDIARQFPKVLSSQIPIEGFGISSRE